MDIQPFFTEEEKKQFFSKYKQLLRHLYSFLKKEDLSKMKELMKRVVALDCYGRDKNGINGLLRNIDTALIATVEIGLKRTSVIALLLYRPVMKKIITLDEVKTTFDADVTLIISRLLKTSDLYARNTAVDSENFHKLLFSFAEDVRVILIMIADRLCLMRLGKQLKNDEDRKRLATEVSYLYAPLAHRLGLYTIKSELEDLSLKYTDRKQYDFIKQKLNETKRSRDAYIAEFITPIKSKLEEAGLQFDIKGRTKSIHSINNKLKKQNIPFEDIYDLFAIRIILDTPYEKERSDCWQVYSIITDMYQPNPKRMKDWISIPKTNGYESLHITVMGPQNKWVEVQIRTERMDEIAERGLAAHWRYKGIKGESGLDEWLTSVREALENSDSSGLETMDQFKLDLYEDEVFVFTPKGDLFKLGKGSTVLDFAFHIHSKLGCKCIGAKVNGRNAQLKQILNSGDQVEILTSKTQRVQKEWINFATTAKAKNKIQAILRREERELQKQGEEILNEFFEKAEVEPNSMNIDKLCDLHRIKFREELFQAIGSKNVVLGTADLNVLHEKQGNKGNSWTHFIPFLKKKSPSSKTKEKPTPEQPISIDRKKTVVLNEENIQNFIIAECCHPIPGDDVLGYIDSDKHIYIHKRQCSVAAKLKTSDGNHILAATWDVHKTLFFPATIKVSGIDNIGILHEMTGVLSNQLNINIYKLTVSTKDGIFDCEIQLGVHDVEDVKTICNKLKNMTGIEEVTRID